MQKRIQFFLSQSFTSSALMLIGLFWFSYFILFTPVSLAADSFNVRSYGLHTSAKLSRPSPLRHDGLRLSRPEFSNTITLAQKNYIPGTVIWTSYPLFGGEMTSIAIAPLNSQTVYVGTRDAGVFKTTDSGQSWQPARTGLTFYPIRSLQIDPGNSDILYAGTDGDGIWKSTDGGNSWFKASSGLDSGMAVFNIDINHQDTNTLYAGLAGGSGLSIGNIYKSTDGGSTWNRKDDGIPRYSDTYTNGIFSLAVDSVNPLLLYTGTNFDGAYTSVDSGETWSAINNGLPFRPGTTIRESVNAMAIDTGNNNRLNALIGGDYYIYNNVLWQQINQGIYYPNSPLSPAHLYFYPSNSNIIYSAGKMFSKSTDAGINWDWLLGWGAGTYSGNITEIAFPVSSPDTIYAASDILWYYLGGVYKSTNQGQIWSDVSQGITAGVIYGVAIDPQNSGNIYAGFSGNLFRTQDGGITWSRGYDASYGIPDGYNLGSEITDIAVDPSNSQNIYLAADSDFYKSDNQGATFNLIGDIQSPRCIAIHPSNSSNIYVGTQSNGIYKSSDGGFTWSKKNKGLPLFGGSIIPILSLAVDPANPNIIWAGTQYGGGIVKTIDGGENWNVKGLTDENFVEAIAVSPDNSNIILVGAGFWEGRIYKSGDGGKTWKKKIDNIAFVKDIKFDTRNSYIIYAATEGYGILRSTDGGDTWHDYSQDIFYPVSYKLAISSDMQPLLIAGTYGSGLYGMYPEMPPITYNEITLLKPNGGESIPSGSPDNPIEWGAPSNAVKFKLQYSTDNGLTWKLIADNLAGTSYNWKAPAPSNNKRKCRIKVIGYDALNIKIGADKSNAPFTIEVVRLTAPSGAGISITSGLPYTINWTINETKNSVTSVKLYYTKDGGLTWKRTHTLSGSYPAGNYSQSWTVPGVATAKTKCKVKIVLKNFKGNAVGSDQSDNFFTIQPSP